MVKKIEDKYQKKELRQHIIDRPDSYIGSIKSLTEEIYILKDNKMVKKPITYVPGLYKIFDEILVNAMDHSVNDLTVSQIKVNVNKTTGEISVMNDGKGIEIVMHKTENVYIPELIFGNLLTSSNYDDSEERTTGGRNGLGGKVANIFSTSFIVETIDSDKGKKYIQKFSNNMLNKDTPKITTNSGKSYTKITFIPDFPKFGMKSLDDDIISLLEKRVYDCAACTKPSVNVYYNGVMIKHKTFEKYVDLFIGSKTDTKRVFQSGNNGWEIACCLNDEDKLQQMSFVNGIWTINGGRHVEYITFQITKKLTELIQSKHKNLTIKQNYIKDRLFIFLKSYIINPTFESQTKEKLTSNVKDFGFKFDISNEFITKLSKCGIIEEIVAFAKHKETRDLAKQTDGSKKTKIRVEKLDDANWAGSSKSKECTLILTEGDSAKTFAVAGLSIVGRDKYGVYPLRGKLLNLRDASAKKIMENKEITELKTILGLQEKKVYKDLSELRYGKIMIITDADTDGHHIKGLIINMIHTGWESLIKYHDFITAMKTPIVKASKKSEILEFYNISEYNQWKDKNNTNGWFIKYYKGLGTSTANEAKSYFKNMKKTIINYKWDKNSDSFIKLAFEKKQADNRKLWIGKYNKNLTIENEKNVNFSDFINKELIHFSVNDLERSIPSICDGLKPSQRKVLFYMIKKNINKEKKVFQLGGSISSETCYHHGPASMEGTIIAMAQDFVGSNNINLLEPIGQFGSKLAGGKDAASSRYINTKLSPITTTIFHPDDNALLNYLDDDGESIEPEWYLPIIPMVLINGVEGIGTGYSSFIPCYNPKDILKNINCLLNNKPLQELTPFYNGFQGTIEKINDKSYISKGIYKRLSPTKIEIVELPIGRWTNDYKEFLDNDDMDKIIRNFENHSTEDKVLFNIEFKSSDALDTLINSGNIYKDFKLTKQFSINNMNLFDKNGQIKKYNDPNDIIKEFYNIRLDFYNKRRNHMINVYNNQILIAEARVRFIMAVIDNRLVISKKTKSEIEFQLNELQFQKQDDDYKYLLDMPIYSLSIEKINELKKKLKSIKESLQYLEETDIDEMWIDDLNTYLKN